MTTSDNHLTLWHWIVRAFDNQRQLSDTATLDCQRLRQPATTVWHCDARPSEAVTTSNNCLTLQHWIVRAFDNQRQPSDTAMPDRQSLWQPATTVWHCDAGSSEPLTTSDNRLTLQCQTIRAFDNQRQSLTAYSAGLFYNPESDHIHLHCTLILLIALLHWLSCIILQIPSIYAISVDIRVVYIIAQYSVKTCTWCLSSILSLCNVLGMHSILLVIWNKMWNTTVCCTW